jgi:hypothetical protein
VHTASTTGGTVIRVYADSSYTFASTTACPLAAAVDGVALTKVTVHGSSAGNYFTGVIGAHAADAAPVLKITDACVSKSFQYDAAFGTQTHDFQLAGSTISISPASGAIDGGNTLTITGAGFGNTTTVDVGGTACGSVTVVSSKKITCTVPSVQAAGPVTISTTNPTSVISAGTTYTYLDQ